MMDLYHYNYGTDNENGNKSYKIKVKIGKTAENLWKRFDYYQQSKKNILDCFSTVWSVDGRFVMKVMVGEKTLKLFQTSSIMGICYLQVVGVSLLQ